MKVFGLCRKNVKRQFLFKLVHRYLGVIATEECLSNILSGHPLLILKKLQQLAEYIDGQ